MTDTTQWTFFTDNTDKVLCFDNVEHARAQIKYYKENKNNGVDYYWIDQEIPTRIIKGEQIYEICE